MPFQNLSSELVSPVQSESSPEVKIAVKNSDQSQRVFNQMPQHVFATLQIGLRVASAVPVLDRQCQSFLSRQ